MSYDIELAKMFKERNNKKSIGAIIGKIVGVNPYKISIFDGQIILQQEQLYFCENILNNTNSLKANDEVMLIAAENGQKFFVIDKVVKL